MPNDWQIVALVFAGFSLIRLGVALSNLCLRPRLRDKPLDVFPAVSILVPARNEANTIGPLLDDLSKLTYPHYTVVVYDDLSEDNTAEVVRSFTRQIPGLRLVQGKPLPRGWLGKPHACHQLALTAQGSCLLFLDADVRVDPDFLQKAVGELRHSGSGLLSVFPSQVMVTKGERWTVPVMNWILLSFLPLVFVRWSGWKAFAAANGQVMLFDAEMYRRSQPHAMCRAARVEDMAIARLFRANKIRTSLFLGGRDIRCRMYRNYTEAMNGFAKNVTAFFGDSSLMAIAFVLFSLLSPVVFYQAWGIAGLLSLLLVWSLIRLATSLTAHEPVLLNLINSPLIFISLVLMIFRNLIATYSRTLQWKGRPIS